MNRMYRLALIKSDKAKTIIQSDSPGRQFYMRAISQKNPLIIVEDKNIRPSVFCLYNLIKTNHIIIKSLIQIAYYNIILCDYPFLQYLIINKRMKQKQQRQYHQKREYFSLIEKVGSWNRYQFYLFLIFSMVNLFDSALMFVPPLLFYHGTYQCQELTSDHCTQFVCSLDPSERKQYLPDAPFHSLAHQLDLDFQCEHAGTLTLFSSLVFIGSIGGMLIFSTFTERIGRKSSLTLSLAIMAVGLLLTYLGGLLQSIPLIVCGMLLTYCGCENGYQYVYCFSTEVVAEEWRISYINLLNVIYGLGMVIDALVFYYIKEWTQIYLYVFIVPAVLTLVAVMAVIEKTPMDMLSSETETEVMARLQRIASINNKQFTVTLQEVQHIKSGLEESLAHADNQSFTIIDVFGYKSLRGIILPLMFLNFTVNYLFFSPSVINNSITDDLFTESIIEVLSYSASVIAIHFFLEYVSRRLTNLLISLSTLVLLVLLLLEDDNQQSLLHSVLYFAFRFVVSMGFLSVYLINYESFPTQIRAVGATLGYLIGNTSGLLQPFLATLWNQLGWNVLFSFMAISALSVLPNIFITETFKVPPPEIIQELQHSHDKDAKR